MSLAALTIPIGSVFENGEGKMLYIKCCIQTYYQREVTSNSEFGNAESGHLQQLYNPEVVNTKALNSFKNKIDKLWSNEEKYSFIFFIKLC